jgi:molybdate transport system ATP-binding protein
MLRIDLTVGRGAFRLQARLDIPTPGVTALFGPSGAGKTSLAHAIAGLIPATGLIELDGIVLLDSEHGINIPCEYRRVGCAFQDARLFPHLSVAENLRYGLCRQRGLQYAHWNEVIDLLGIGSLLARRPHSLSGGERQRVALGRALLAQPQLLILDEPLASVDQSRRQEVLPYLEQLRDRYCLPMIYVSHQFEEVLRLATDVALMDGGAVKAYGTPTELSLSAQWRQRTGSSNVGAIIESVVLDSDIAEGMTTVSLGGERLHLPGNSDPTGKRVRLHIPADDVMLATEVPLGLSVRNALPAIVIALESEANGLVLVTIAIGADRLLSRITRKAVTELSLHPGCAVWALIKAAALSHRIYHPDPKLVAAE